MGVTDGQAVNQAVSNAAWISKNTDDSTPSRLGLGSANPVEGPAITSSQREHNAHASFMGAAINQVFNYLPTWTNNNVGSPTDDLKQRIEALTAAAFGSSSRADSVTLTSSISTITVVFATVLPSAVFVPVCTMSNVTDPFPQKQPIVVTNKTTTGFTAVWDTPTDSANYVLEYVVVQP